MESDGWFTAAEWYDFLINEVTMPPAAKDEIEKLARTLEHHYISKDLFISFSEEDLRTKFQFERHGLLSQFTKWKNSLSKSTTDTEKINSNAESISEPSLTLQTNPLVDLIDILKKPVNQNQIGAALSLLVTNTSNVSEIVPNYLSVVSALERFGADVPASERVYYRCRACEKCVWVVKGMSALMEFPGCFSCQKDWLRTLGESLK